MQGGTVAGGNIGLVIGAHSAFSSDSWNRAAPISAKMRRSVVLSETMNSTEHCDCLHIRHCYACFVEDANERKESEPNEHKSAHPQGLRVRRKELHNTAQLHSAEAKEEEEEVLNSVKYFRFVPKCCGELSLIQEVDRIGPSYNAPCYETEAELDENDWKAHGDAELCSRVDMVDAQTSTNMFSVWMVLIFCIAWMTALVVVHDCLHALGGGAHGGHGKHDEDEHHDGDHGHRNEAVGKDHDHHAAA